MADNAVAIFEGKEVDEFLKKLKAKAKPNATLMKELGGVISATVFQDIMDHFNQEEGPDGAWTEWSKSYIEYMQRIGKGGNKILQDSGRLRGGFLPGNYKPETGGILFFNRAQTKTGFPYAAAHDAGGPKLPQRKFMWISDGALENVAERTLAWVLDVS